MWRSSYSFDHYLVANDKIRRELKIIPIHLFTKRFEDILDSKNGKIFSANSLKSSRTNITAFYCLHETLKRWSEACCWLRSCE